MTTRPHRKRPRTGAPRNIAVVGAGMAGLACARTLAQAGHAVTVFERRPRSAGAWRARDSLRRLRQRHPILHGARCALCRGRWKPRRQLCKPWSANAVRVLDAHGRVAEAALPSREPHLVASAGHGRAGGALGTPLRRAIARARTPASRASSAMRSTPSAGSCARRAPTARSMCYAGFDAVLLAMPPARTRAAATADAPALLSRIEPCA